MKVGFIMDLFSIIIVNYNSRELLCQCLNSISINSDQIASEVIVIDNNSQDDSVAYLHKYYPEIKLIENNKDVGFGKACNQGIKIARGRYIILLNDDCEIFTNTLSMLKQLTERLIPEDRIGIIGGKILNSDRTLQFSYGKFPTVFSTILDMFKPPEQRKVQVSGYDIPHYVDWVTGAFMIINRDIFAEIDYFDKNYFMYYEETDLCFQAKAKGWQILYDPAPQIMHKTPHSTKKENTPLFIQAEIRKSHLYFFRKNRSFSSFVIISIASLKLLLLKWCINLFKDTTRRKETEKLLSVVWITFLKLASNKKYSLDKIASVSKTDPDN